MFTSTGSGRSLGSLGSGGTSRAATTTTATAAATAAMVEDLEAGIIVDSVHASSSSPSKSSQRPDHHNHHHRRHAAAVEEDEEFALIAPQLPTTIAAARPSTMSSTSLRLGGQLEDDSHDHSGSAVAATAGGVSGGELPSRSPSRSSRRAARASSIASASSSSPPHPSSSSLVSINAHKNWSPDHVSPSQQRLRSTTKSIQALSSPASWEDPTSLWQPSSFSPSRSTTLSMKAISPFSVHDPRVQASVERARAKILSPTLREDPALLDFIDEIVELSHAEAPPPDDTASASEAAAAVGVVAGMTPSGKASADESLPLESLISWPFVAASPSASASASMSLSSQQQQQQQLVSQHEA